MDRKSRIEHEVEETLRAFEREAAPAPRPDFYAHVRTKLLGAEASDPLVPSFPFVRRILLPAGLAAMIALNILTVLSLGRQPASPSPGRQQAMTALAREYDLKTDAVSAYWK